MDTKTNLTLAGRTAAAGEAALLADRSVLDCAVRKRVAYVVANGRFDPSRFADCADQWAMVT